MKKLTLAIMIGATMSTAAIAGNQDMKLSESFDQLDANNDGHVTPNEFKDVESEKRVDKFMSKMDGNADSLIDRNEFESYVVANPSKFSDAIVTKVKAQGTTDAIITRKIESEGISRSADWNVNDKIDTDNAALTMSITNKFENADSNDDGALSKMEVANADIDGDFSEMDKDDNRLLTKVEFREYIVDK